MTAGGIDGAGAPGSSRVEVRWIVRGVLPVPVSAWFARFPASTERREDNYLVMPSLPGLNVKVRGDVTLEVKEYLGSRGILEVPGYVRGHLESWRKASFPLSARTQIPPDSRSWRRVQKHRRCSAFLPDEDRVISPLPITNSRLMCTVELSDVLVCDQAWWTLALESVGPLDRLEEAIDVTALRFLGAGFAEDVKLDLADSGSYSDWLKDLQDHGWR